MREGAFDIIRQSVATGQGNEGKTLLASWTTPKAPKQAKDRAPMGQPVSSQGRMPENTSKGSWYDLTGEHLPDDGYVVGKKAEPNVSAKKAVDPEWAKKQADYEARLERLDALGISDELGMKAGALTTFEPRKVKPMSWEDYNKLSPRAKAGVDFNTMLNRAVQRDLKLQDNYDKKNIPEEYKIGIREIFGEGRDSDAEIYAPETLAALQTLKLKDPGGDLDDYLSLRVGITNEDVDRLFNGKPGVSGANAADAGQQDWAARTSPGSQARQAYMNMLATATEDLQVALARDLANGNKVLQDWRSTAQAAREASVLRFGGSAGQPRRDLGFGNGASPELDAKIASTYEALLAQPENKVNELMADLRANVTPEEFDAFYNYAAARTRNAQRGRGPLTANEKAKITDPNKFAALLQLDEQ